MTIRDHHKLLQSLRSAHDQLGTRPVVAAEAAEYDAPDFSSLESYHRISLAKRAGEVLGLASPFLRNINKVDGTRAEIGGRPIVNFASYDYLSLNGSNALAEAVANAVSQWGVSATASRLVGGEHDYHRALESGLADFLGTEDSVALVSGYLTNCTLIRSLVGPGDLVLVDQRAHNSIYEGIRISGAEHKSIPHNNWAWAGEYLEANRAEFRNVLIAIEGLYSMDGDMPELPRFVEIKKRFGAWLLVDEAHSIGVLGATGRGIREEQNVPAKDVDVTMGTLSKTFCSCGGFLAGSRELGELIRYSAPGFVYSVGLAAPLAAAATEALRRLASETERVTRLRQIASFFQDEAQRLGLTTEASATFAVQPIFLGDSLRATWMSNQLLDAGYNVLPIIAPAVPDKAARLRVFLNADHTKDDVTGLLEATARLLAKSYDDLPKKA